MGSYSIHVVLFFLTTYSHASRALPSRHPHAAAWGRNPSRRRPSSLLRRRRSSSPAKPGDALGWRRRGHLPRLHLAPARVWRRWRGRGGGTARSWRRRGGGAPRGDGGAAVGLYAAPSRASPDPVAPPDLAGVTTAARRRVSAWPATVLIDAGALGRSSSGAVSSATTVPGRRRLSGRPAVARTVSRRCSRRGRSGAGYRVVLAGLPTCCGFCRRRGRRLHLPPFWSSRSSSPLLQ